MANPYNFAMVWKPSVTVAAVVRDGGRFLLVEEHTPEGLRLNNPAGHLEQGESPLQAVVREALEETAREFTPEAFLGCYVSRFRRVIQGQVYAEQPGLNQDKNDYTNNSIKADEIEDITYLRLAFTGSVGAPLPGRTLDREIVRTLWMTADELRASQARHRSPLVLRCIEDALAGRNYPLDAVYTHESIYE